jgi:hypothetical protein
MPTVEELEAKFETLKKELEKREKQVADQNSYITKLEASRAQVSNAQPQPSAQAVDPTVQKYIERKMRIDTIEEAVLEIKRFYPIKEFEAVYPDLIAFLDKNMRKENTTVNFVVDAFDLMYGRAVKNKDHALHQVGKAGAPTSTPETNSSVVATANEQAIKALAPTISPQDGTSGTLPDNGLQVKDTKDAFAALKTKFNNVGRNKFQ